MNTDCFFFRGQGYGEICTYVCLLGGKNIAHYIDTPTENSVCLLLLHKFLKRKQITQL